LDLVQSLWQQHVHMWQEAQQILPVCLVGPPAAMICTSTPIKFAAQHLNQNLLLYLSVACFLWKGVENGIELQQKWSFLALFPKYANIFKLCFRK
jgi:hypothetical protein